jgi:hypothetical protein
LFLFLEVENFFATVKGSRWGGRARTHVRPLKYRFSFGKILVQAKFCPHPAAQAAVLLT